MGYWTGSSIGRDVQRTQIGHVRAWGLLILLLRRSTGKAMFG